MCIFYVELNAQTKAHLPIDSPLFNFFCIFVIGVPMRIPFTVGGVEAFPEFPSPVILEVLSPF